MTIIGLYIDLPFGVTMQPTNLDSGRQCSSEATSFLTVYATLAVNLLKYRVVTYLCTYILSQLLLSKHAPFGSSKAILRSSNCFDVPFWTFYPIPLCIRPLHRTNIHQTHWTCPHWTSGELNFGRLISWLKWPFIPILS